MWLKYSGSYPKWLAFVSRMCQYRWRHLSKLLMCLSKRQTVRRRSKTKLEVWSGKAILDRKGKNHPNFQTFRRQSHLVTSQFMSVRFELRPVSCHWPWKDLELNFRTDSWLLPQMCTLGKALSELFLWNQSKIQFHFDESPCMFQQEECQCFLKLADLMKQVGGTQSREDL